MLKYPFCCAFVKSRLPNEYLKARATFLHEFAPVRSIHSKRLENGKMEAVIVDRVIHAASDGRKVEASLRHLR